MYKCQCETKYDLTLAHYEAIGTMCEKNGIAMTVIICPGCHRARIVGAEADWDEIGKKPCNMMFGFDVTENNVLGAPVFVGKKEE